MVDSFNQQNNVGVNVGFQVDRRQARDAATTLDEFNRAVKDVERQRGLSHIARDAAEVVKQTDSARQGAIRLQAELVKVGATQSEVRKVVGEYDRLVQKQQQAAEQARRVAEETKRLNAEFFANLPEPGLDAFFGSKRGGTGLRGLGRAARVNLPAVPIGQFSTEQVARLVEGVGFVDEALAKAGFTAAQTVAVFGGLTAAIAFVGAVAITTQKQVEEAEKAKLAQLSAEERARRAAVSASTDEIRVLKEVAEEEAAFREQRLEGLRQQRDQLQSELRELKIEPEFLIDLDTSPLEKLAGALGVFDAELSDASQNVNTLQGQYNALDASIKENEQALEAARIEVGEYTNVLRDNATAANDAALIIEARQKEIDDAQRQRLSLQRSFAGEDNLESLDKRIDTLTLEREALADFLQEGNLSAELTQELHQEYVNLNREINILSGNIREEVAARDAARVAAEDQKRTQEEIADATRGYQEAIADLAEDTANKRIQIEQGYADKITDLTRKYTEDVEKAVVSLQRKRADIALDVNRDIAKSERKAQFDRLQEQIEFGNETAKQSRELERELARIRDDAANNQLDLIRNRDFAGLERLERDRDRALDQAVDNFNVEQREREIAFRQQQELTNQELVFEAETRRIRFEQQIEDARRAHDRQLADLQQANLRQRQLLAQARQQELNQLAAAESAKLQLLAQGYSQELKLAAQTTAMRVNLLQQEQQALLAFASAFQGGGGVVNNTSNSRSVSVPISIQSGASQQQLQQLGPTIQTLVVKAIDQLIN